MVRINIQSQKNISLHHPHDNSPINYFSLVHTRTNLHFAEVGVFADVHSQYKRSNNKVEYNKRLQYIAVKYSSFRM